jgi:hypothetical protein
MAGYLSYLEENEVMIFVLVLILFALGFSSLVYKDNCRNTREAIQAFSAILFADVLLYGIIVWLF